MLLGGGPSVRIDRALFESYIDKSGDCWMWTGCTDREGYGHFMFRRMDGSRAKGRAHRLAVLLDGRELPSGYVVDHLCRVTGCVNPAHLDVVTPRENTLRGLGPAAVNAARTHCVNGHEFSPENTRVETRPGGGTIRACRACDRIAQVAFRARKARREKGNAS